MLLPSVSVPHSSPAGGCEGTLANGLHRSPGCGVAVLPAGPWASPLSLHWGDTSGKASSSGPGFPSGDKAWMVGTQSVRFREQALGWEDTGPQRITLTLSQKSHSTEDVSSPSCWLS